MANLTYLAAVIFLLLQLICSCAGFNCVKVHSCKCKLDDGTVIDLSPIGSKTGEARQLECQLNGIKQYNKSNCKNIKGYSIINVGFEDPFSFENAKKSLKIPKGKIRIRNINKLLVLLYVTRFKNVPDAGFGDVWSYNPCYSFTENSCNDVASCQIRNGAGFNAGTQDSVQFKFEEQNGMALVYSATTDGVLRTTYTYLQCEPNEDGALNVLGEITPDGNYYMYLTSKYACPTDDISGSSSGLSGGSILIIIVVVFIFVYLVGGMVFQTVLRKAEGKERVPNIAFWSALPSLIKEGFQFTYRSVREKAGYSSI